LLYFISIWHIFPRLGMLHPEKSGKTAGAELLVSPSTPHLAMFVEPVRGSKGIIA
jgi:hypothetical protein